MGELNKEKTIKTELSVGQYLWWFRRESLEEGTVRVSGISKEGFTVLYHGKCIYRPYTALNHTLFFESQLKKQEEAPAIRKCENCKYYRNETCGAVSGRICEDYSPIPHISDEEIASWPQYGDATAYKLRDYSRFSAKKTK
jgi:hypothetical protein